MFLTVVRRSTIIALVLLTFSAVLFTNMPSGNAGVAVNIVILGGESAVSASVQAELERCTAGTVTRQAGNNRYQTATAISKSAFSSASGAYIATGFNFPDALAGGPAASIAGQPVLLVNDAVPASTLIELQRLGVSKVTVLGGSAVVPDSVVASLNTLIPTTRIAGSNRYSTAAAIVQATFATANTVYVATGLNFPDALAGVPAAAGDAAPILLVQQDSIPGSTVGELNRLKPTTIKILGGESVVSAEVANTLTSYASNVIRLAGSDRYSTATAISKHAFPGGAPKIYIATGSNYPDALAGGPAAGFGDAPILLVQQDAIPGSTRAEIQRLTGRTCQPIKTFGNGTWIAGTDISPGTYRTAASSDGCYGARLSGFGGTLDDIIENDFTYDTNIVTIESADAGFESSRCNVWTTDTTPRTTSPTADLNAGAWVVSKEVAAGLWRNSDSNGGCYWERLSGFSWSTGDIIANNFTYAIQTVRIEPGDTGFNSSRCGQWTYLSP